MEQLIQHYVNEELEVKNIINASQHVGIESRSCQTNVLYFFGNITGLVDKDNSVDIIYLDFSNEFGLVPHDI